MGDAYSIPDIRDRGGRRLESDRRMLWIPGHGPERRSNQDRRRVQDRRSGKGLGDILHLRRNLDRFMEFANTQKGIFLGILLSLPLWALIIFTIINNGKP